MNPKVNVVISTQQGNALAAFTVSPNEWDEVLPKGEQLKTPEQLAKAVFEHLNTHFTVD